MQVSSLPAQDLFHLRFRATCKSLNDRGQLLASDNELAKAQPADKLHLDKAAWPQTAFVGP